MDLAALTSNLQNKSKLRQTFSDTELAEFAQHLCPESVSSGTIVMGHGEPADNMIFILEGSVQILEGERKIAMSSAGDFAGESLFSDNLGSLHVLPAQPGAVPAQHRAASHRATPNGPPPCSHLHQDVNN